MSLIGTIFGALLLIALFFVSFLIMLFLRNFMPICALLTFSLVSNLGILLACVPGSSKRLLLIMLQIIHLFIVRSRTPHKAFDRVHYCKLFRLLVKRGLPTCIVRILINLYTVNQVRVLWAGLTSDYFAALNGVKQGGVISPILFRIYIDDLLTRLS